MKPNYLFIITDQHRADHLGCYGNKTVKTPNIDTLAKTGRRFDNFYVANPICMSNRASILTGRMPSLHGVRHNGIPLSRDDTTFVEVLKAAGYRTALIGKSHIQAMTGLPATISYNVGEGMEPPDESLREASHRSRSGEEYDQELADRWRSNIGHRVKTPFYGFDHVLIANDHADQVTGDYEVWLKDQGVDPDTLRGPENALPDDRYCAPQAWRTRVPEELYPTHYVAKKSAEYLKSYAQGDRKKPFFLTMSFPDPHHPFTPPGKYWDMYDPKDITLPESFGKGDLPPLKAMREARKNGTDNRKGQDPFIVSEREAREIIALTYGSISLIDDAIGWVIETLKDHGLDENTVICFTSDHGDHMGDHGLMLKLLLHYRGLIRVPFIWSDPMDRVRGDSDQRLFSSIDIAPSILKRSGIQPYNGVQGIDFLRENATERHGLIVEEDSQRKMVAFQKPQRVRTYVTHEWRLSLRLGEDWSELYDLKNDPDELKNLWSDPDYKDVKNRLIDEMLRETVSLQDRSPLPKYRA